MRYSEIIPLAASIVNFGLALFVFSRDWKATINRVYLLWGVAIGVWNLGTFFMFRVPLSDRLSDRLDAIFWARFLQFGVIFLPVTLFHLGLLIAKIRTGRVLPMLYVTHILLALSNFGGFFIKGVHIARGSNDLPYAWYSTGGPGFYFFCLIYVCQTWATMIILHRELKHLTPLHRTRVKLIIASCGILIFFGNNDILPILGFYHYPFTDVPIYPLGSLAAIFYGIVTAHSVLQHQLMDIHVTLGKSSARAVRVFFMMLVCLTLLLIAHTVFPGQVTGKGLWIVMTVFLLSAITASVLFPQLFGKGSDALARRILGDRFEYEDKIQGFIESLPWYTDTKSLMNDFHDLLTKVMMLQSYCIILQDETARKFTIYRSHPGFASDVPLDLERNSPVFRYFTNTHNDCLVLNPEYSNTERTPNDLQACQQLNMFNADFCYAFFAEEDPVGFLLIGKKMQDKPHSHHEMNLMRMVVKNLSLIMNQIRLKQRVLVAEEMELLGRMSRGMAHDLNNLITPVSTYVQLAQECASHDDPSYELLPTVARNVETIQTYIKESLFYSNTLTPHFQKGRLDETARKAVQLVKPQLAEKQIQVVCRDLPEAVVEMDAVLIQRMLSNLLGNAGDASPAGSEISLELARMAGMESNRDWYRLKVIDHGSGISSENLPHVFRPYFTTKDRGSGKRGFGLGLAICKKIVVLHGGNLNIQSEPNVGTTIIVDLPSRISANNPEKPKQHFDHAEAA
jgi:signal transduction histidine kinase